VTPGVHAAKENDDAVVIASKTNERKTWTEQTHVTASHCRINTI